MGRKSRFDRKAMTGAALRLAAERGPQAVTMAAVAQAVGAPTGSVYHRYASRDELLAELWIDVVEGFQSRFTEQLARAAGVEGAVATARFMAAWTREHASEARLLLLHRRQDFVAGEWPALLVTRAAALEPALGRALREFGRRVYGRADAGVLTRLRYALLDAPLGAVKPYLQQRKHPPPLVDELIEATVRAVLSDCSSRPRPSKRRFSHDRPSSRAPDRPLSGSLDLAGRRTRP